MGTKLGIIFAFFLSLAAAGGSYYLYQEWVKERDVRGSVEAKVVQVEEKMSSVQAEKKQLEVKNEEYRTKAEAMQSQLEKLQSEQNRMDSEKSALKQQLEGHQGLIADLQKKVEELEKKAKEAQAACAVTPADLKTDIPSNPQPFQSSPGVSPAVSGTATPAAGSNALEFKPASPAGEAAAQPAAMSSSYAPAMREEAPVLHSSVLSGGAPVAISASSAKGTVQAGEVSSGAAAKVLTVNRKFNFVVISQGLQHGLKMGDKLRVLKQGQEVATIQVEKLYDKFSAASLLEEDPKQQVVEGDEIRKV